MRCTRTPYTPRPTPNLHPHTYRIIPHNRQSYFGPYFLDEKGTHPKLRGPSKGIAAQLAKLQEAREEHVNFTANEEVGLGWGWWGY